MGVRADLFETSAPPSLIKTFQMNLISVGSILLNSTFKRFYFEFFCWSVRYYFNPIFAFLQPLLYAYYYLHVQKITSKSTLNMSKTVTEVDI